MSVEAHNIIFHSVFSKTETDAASPVGGTIDRTTKLTFNDMVVTASVVIHSNSASDTDVFLDVYGRDASGALINYTKVCTGTTGSVIGTSYERLLKVLKVSATAYAGSICAVQGAAASVFGTAQSGSALYIQLESGDISADNDYKGKVVRIIQGTGIGEFGEIVRTTSSDDRAYVRRPWGTDPDATSRFEIRSGAVLEKVIGYTGTTSEIMVVARPFYNAASDPSSVSTLYEKAFVMNVHGTLTLSNTTIQEVATGLYASISFALATAFSDTATIVDRKIAAASLPSNITAFFDDTDGAQDFPNSKNFTNGAKLGVWLRLSMAAGAAAQNSFYEMQVNGQST